jgi:hypothetical protein
MRMFALTTTQGTAMPETGLCGVHVEDGEARARALQAAADDLGEPRFVDCTGNPELACTACGAGGEDRAPG